jgi:hypothetical protein
MATRKPRPQEKESSKLRWVPHPIRLSEDEADIIISERRYEEDPVGTPWEEVFRELGLDVDGHAERWRKKISKKPDAKE